MVKNALVTNIILVPWDIRERALLQWFWCI